MKVFHILIFLLFSIISPAQSNPDSLFSRGNQKYAQSDYSEAEKYYKQILEQGLESPELFFNLGNTMYQQNKIPEAIYYYEKALKLNPGFKQAKSNLQMAQRYAGGNKIPAVPEPFYKKILQKISGIFSMDTWAGLSLFWLFLAVSAYAAYLSVKRPGQKRFFFSVIIISAFLWGFSWGMASLRFKEYNKQVAIIITENANAYSAPDLSSEKVNILKPGQKVIILQSQDPWLKILLPDGQEVWIDKEKVKKI